MEIQQEIPRPRDPLGTLDEDYARAVLHLAWTQPAQAEQRTLLFAFVELLPVEVPPPLDDGEQREQLGDAGAPWVHVRRIVMPARQGLGWYLGCRRGLAVIPNPEGQVCAPEDPAAARFVMAELGEEPSWPTLVCAASGSVPFCAAWHATPRVHHLVPLADLALDKLWHDDGERLKAIRWLSDRLHFRMEDYPEYWGSVHLVAPNPVYRSLDTRWQGRTPPHESVLWRVRPRTGKSIEGLELTFTEEAPWGQVDVRHVTARSPLVRLEFDRAVGAHKTEVFDPRRGLLEHEPVASHFWKTVSVIVRDDSEPVAPVEAAKASSASERLQRAARARRKRAQERQQEGGAEPEA